MQTNPEYKLGKSEYKTLSLAALGGALEFYDFIIFVFFAKIISQLFFPAGMADWLKLVQTYGLFAAGYLARPFGGILMAHFGDIVGRKRMFSLSIFLMAIPTLCIGLLPTYATAGIAAPLLLLLMRILQGAAVGGEVPGAWVFVSEHVPKNRIGLACGILTSGLTSGILFGSLIAASLEKVLGPEEIMANGWRYPFIIGGLFGLVALYLRRFLEETPIFKMMKARKTDSKFPLKDVLHSHPADILRAMILTWILSAGILIIILMAPEYLETNYKFQRVATLEANSFAIILLSIGCTFYGTLADKIGAGITLTIGSIVMIIATYLFYYSAANHPEHFFVSYCFAGFATGVVGAFSYVMVNSFPAAVRFTGISFSFNVAYAIAGGLTPVLIVTLIEKTGSKMIPAFYVITLFSVCLLMGVFFILRKNLLTRYKDIGLGE